MINFIKLVFITASKDGVAVRVIALFVSLFVMKVLAVTLSMQELGEYAILLSVINLIVLISQYGTYRSNYMIGTVDVKNKMMIKGEPLLVCCVLCIVCSIIGLIYLSSSSRDIQINLVILGIIIGNICFIQNYFASYLKIFGKYNLFQMIASQGQLPHMGNGIMGGLCLIVFILLIPSVSFLNILCVVVASQSIILLGVIYKVINCLKIYKFKISNIKIFIKQNFKFFTMTSLFAFAQPIEIILFELCSGSKEELGGYYAVVKVGAIVLLPVSLYSVTLELKLKELHQSVKTEVFSRYIYKLSFKFVCVATMVYLGVIILWDQIIIILFSSDYLKYLSFFIIRGFGCLFESASAPILAALVVLDRLPILSVLLLVMQLLLVLMLIYMATLGISIIYCVICISAISLTKYLLLLKVSSMRSSN